MQEVAKAGLDNFRIYLGTNLIHTNASTTHVKIAAVKSHPQFQRKTLNYDVALLKLAAPVTFSDTVMPICLGQGGAPHVGRSAVVAGWGSLSDKTNPVNQLRNVNVSSLSWQRVV